MKKLMSFFLLVMFGVTVFAQNSYSQPDYKNDTRRVYWFDIALKTKSDPDTKIPQYYVYPLGTQIKYGTAAEYDKYLWDGLSNGSRIAIGPFDSREQATYSLRLYDMNKAPKDSLLMSDNVTLYYYVVTLKKTQRLTSFDFERIPAAVASGNAKDFTALLNASLKVDRLIIGGFYSTPEAENSKRIFRLEE